MRSIHSPLFIFLVICTMLVSCWRVTDLTSEPEIRKLATYVNPFIGTGGHGHTFPGACLPHGMVQLSPDTRLDSWDGCSGYHYSDSIVYGFSHTHLSGTGVSDYGDILLMPGTGEPVLNNGRWGKPGYSSRFNKESETATAGYYSVYLDDPQIEVELTASARTGFHRYQFPKNETGYIILDLEHRDEVIESGYRIVNETEVEGYRISRSWAMEQHIYFVAKFSESFVEISAREDLGENFLNRMITGTDQVLAFQFDTIQNAVVLVKVGISAVDINGARQNLETEIPHWNFEKTKAAAIQSWESELQKIQIEAADSIKEIFYSAMYHNAIAPNLYSDVDGRYRSTDLKIHQNSERQQYTVFSLWDTYRATHPLYTIIDQQRTRDYLHTFIDHYMKGGKLPMWELAANYTGCMIGYHSVPVIVDAFRKGITSFDVEIALQAMIETSVAAELGKEDYASCGFLSSEQEHESVSKTLEYAYNDWCIAIMALELGDSTTAVKYFQRAQSYQNLLDPETFLMRPKTDDRWLTPFDPVEVNFSFTEANSWQYSFYVPQDFEGFIDLLGGKSQCEKLLDGLFTAESETYGRDLKDISGLIGQYAHGNEPSHHMAYLYNFVGKPWKSQEIVQQIMSELYTTKPDGLSGNEDCGQMSAWYVFSALGFYPVTPGSNQYALGSPIVDKATIRLENGKQCSITTERNSAASIYIRELWLNGKKLDRNYIEHFEIMEGARLHFVLSDQPNKGRGISDAASPVSKIPDRYRVTPVPGIRKGGRTFLQKDTITLDHIVADSRIFYAWNEFGPWMRYTQPIAIDSTVVLWAYAVQDGRPASRKIMAHFFRIPGNRKLKLLTEYASYYDAGGDLALIDHVKGGDDFRTGPWQGYQGVDLDATVDLGEIRPISTISVRFLQDVNSWIFLPQEVHFSVSEDGLNFEHIRTMKSGISQREEKLVHDFRISSDRKVQYVRIHAINMGTCPSWHKGAGGKSWIFADEISIE